MSDTVEVEVGGIIFNDCCNNNNDNDHQVTDLLDRVEVDVGGKLFTTSVSTLTRSSTYFRRMLSGRTCAPITKTMTITQAHTLCMSLVIGSVGIRNK